MDERKFKGEKIMSDSIPITSLWKGWFGKGKVRYSQLTALKEIINNVIISHANLK